jgi:hypothetical protein
MTVEQHQLAHGAMVWPGLSELPQQLVSLGSQSIDSLVKVRKRALEANDVGASGPGVRAVHGVLRDGSITLRIIVEMLVKSQFLGDQLPPVGQLGKVIVEPQDPPL